MLPIYVVDAFASEPFNGNPAGVCLLKGRTLSDQEMASIASEMKHAETAFLTPMPAPGDYGLRWFTPAIEVDLCGHATLACAHLLWEIGEVKSDSPIRFRTRSGCLVASQADGRIALDFPSVPVRAADLPFLPGFLGAPVFAGTNDMDWFVQLGTESEVLALQTDDAEVARLGLRGLIVTAAPASNADFVSRFFAPQCGIPEDPVTGSAHCALAPFWTDRLGRSCLTGYQASPRGGYVGVELRGDRVTLLGRAVTVLRGELILENRATR